MSKEKYNQIIDEAYENYIRNTPEQHTVGSDFDPMKQLMVWKNKLCHMSGYPILERLSKEEFINKIKTDSEFSEEWGLHIEERELSQEERIKLYEEKTNADTSFFPVLSETLVFHNIPTKVITLTYNNETIESYEN